MPYTILNENLDVCGVLSLDGNGCKFYNDVRSTKIADEQGKIWSDTLDISVPYGYDETDYITRGHHILKEAGDGYHYCYRIYNWVDAAIGSTHVKKALGLNLLAWDLNHKIVPAKTFPLANSQDVFEYILAGSGWEIRQNSFFGDDKPVEITAGQKGMYWLDQQIANFNVEIRAYVQVYNGKIIRKLLDIVDELGESKGYRLEYSHNLLGVVRSGDDSELYTKLFVYGGNDKDNKPISIAAANDNKDYIVDDEANDRYNNGGDYLEGYVSNQDLTTASSLLTWGKEQLKKVNHPRYKYAVDVAHLGYMPNLGDHFQVVDFTMMPELTVSARTIQLDESEANPIDNKVIIGEFVEINVVTPSTVRWLQKKADKAAEELAKLIALKNTFFRQDYEPDLATEGDFWIYTGTDYTIPRVQRLENGIWVSVEEMQGTQGEPGQPGEDGRTTYLHIAYADDALGMGFSQSPEGKSYMGTYVDQVQNDSNNPTDYTWAKIQGPAGPQGPTGLQGIQGPTGNQGIQGPIGPDGKTSYTHIAYAQNSTGTIGFSLGDSEGAIYIGMYVDFTSADSNDPSRYNWTLIKGADGSQGIPGPKGTDGQTPYLHIAYASNATGTQDFSTTESADRTYMGTYTDFTSADSNDPTKYKWVKIQGPQGAPGPQGIQGLQGLQGPKGDQGIAGPAGTSSYTHIAYATNYNGTTGFSVSDSIGKSYIGMYVDSNITDSNDPTKYKWTLIKGADGSQGIQGPTGSDGRTPYLHIAYATNATGTAGFSISDPTNTTYIGTYTDFTITDSTNPSDYIWMKVEGPMGPMGPQGPQGLQGIQGAKGDQGIQGTAGISSYTHIAYATNATGTTGFSTTNSTGATYIGMYVDSNVADSTDPTKYNWTLIKGADGTQGIQGPKGDDGLTSYLHIAYATNATGTAGFSTTDSVGKTYIGTYTDFTAADSNTPSMYTWQLVKGEQGPQGLQGIQGLKGDQGLQGPQGADGTSSYTHIAYAQNATGTVGFSTSSSIDATYIGMYVDSLQNDSNDPTKYNWTLIKGADGEQGIQGPKGADGQTPYLHIAYATNATGTTGFSTTDATGKTYIGTYTDFVSADSTTPSMYTWQLIKGEQGPQGLQGLQGEKGDQGLQGPAGISSYTHIAYATNSTGTTGFSTSDSVNKTYIGMYVDTVQADSTDPTKYKWTLIKGADGAQGIQGPAGSNGQTPYLHIAYATNATGTTGFSTTDATGKTYIGTYTDFTSADSTTPSMYTWQLIKGDTGATGPKGDTGTPGTTTYTWIKYADDSSGNGMSDLPEGKRYLGLAYNKTTSTESTNKADYQWSPLFDNVKVGGRNIVIRKDELQGMYIDTVGAVVSNVNCSVMKDYITVTPGEVLTFTKSTTATGDLNGGHWRWSWHGADKVYINRMANNLNVFQWTVPANTYSIRVSYPVDSYPKIERGNVATDFTLSPEDEFNNIQVGGRNIVLGTSSEYKTLTMGEWWGSLQDKKPLSELGLVVGDKITLSFYAKVPSTAPDSVYPRINYYRADGTYTAASGGTRISPNSEGFTTFTGTIPSDCTEISFGVQRTNAGTGAVSFTYEIKRVKGEKGTVPSDYTTAPEDRENLYTWIKYATSITGANMSDDPTGKDYIGIAYNKDTATESTTASDYTWSLFRGAQGVQGPKGDTGSQGPQGIQGPAGTNGTSQYVHIRYSSASNGNPMTTTPQASTAYVGLANTTSATAPTGYASYTWSLFKGADGSQGIQGPAGANGQTTYTWVKYAEDEYGGNMSDTPSGKRYIGLAFNKTTSVETTSAGDYTWSPLYDNVKVGQRNIIRDTDFSKFDPSTWTSWNGNYSGAIATAVITLDSGEVIDFLNVRSNTGLAAGVPYGYVNSPGRSFSVVAGKEYTLSFLVARHGNAKEDLSYTYLIYDGEPANQRIPTTNVSLHKVYGTMTSPFALTVYEYKLTFTANTTCPTTRLLIGSSTNADFTVNNNYALFYVARLQLEEGNVASSWTPAPEDVQEQLDDKAETSDMDELAKIVSSVSADLNYKAGMGEFQALEEAFNTRVAQDILDKEQLATDLATLEGRTALVEMIAGDSKLVTEFIQTVITESEEGIYIANGASSTGILISSDRISFMDNNVEVAYISNQTMQINHGIFVESATISNFKFEKIPGTTILAITWVGD